MKSAPTIHEKFFSSTYCGEKGKWTRKPERVTCEKCACIKRGMKQIRYIESGRAVA